MKEFTFDEINIIDLALETLKNEIEMRINDIRSVIRKTGEYNKYSRTMDDKYTTDEINTDLEMIKEIDKVLKKLYK